MISFSTKWFQISTNYCEVLSKLISDGIAVGLAIELFSGLEIEIIDFSEKHAMKTAELRPLTKHLGLSLADRSCLALAILQNTIAITADKSWAKLDLCSIEIIR